MHQKAPPKPLSAYVLFFKDLKKREDPNAQQKSSVKDAGRLWNALSQEEKDKYQKQAQRLKQEYQDYMAKHGAATNENDELLEDKVEQEQ